MIWKRICLDCFCINYILIVAAVSNGANMTDGLDGLAAGTSAIRVVLVIFAYVGNLIAADYLNICIYLILENW